MNNKKTIKSVVKAQGIGIFSGKNINLTLRPADVDNGIVFNVGSHFIQAKSKNTNVNKLTTQLVNNVIVISTVEHMMSALSGMEIDNINIELDTNELVNVKLRYKEPTGNTSQLIVKPVMDNKVAFAQSSNNFRFSSAVAGFGMLLRDSKFKGDINYQAVIDIAKYAKGKDLEGYRSEFVQLVEKAEMADKKRKKDQENKKVKSGDSGGQLPVLDKKSLPLNYN